MFTVIFHTLLIGLLMVYAYLVGREHELKGTKASRFYLALIFLVAWYFVMNIWGDGIIRGEAHCPEAALTTQETPCR